MKADYVSLTEMDGYKITARHVRGLQIGERNLQVNTYEYEVERPDIDFASVLSRADVRGALKSLSADPDNAELQRKADRVLAQGPFFRRAPELRVEQSSMSSERQSRLFEAFIFVRKCQGVQVSNDATQENRFMYVVAPTVHARQLLADDPSVRAEFIRCVCTADVGRSEDKFTDELASALEGAILTSPDIRTMGDSFQLSARDSVDIVGGDGVQVDTGSEGRQENTVSAVVVIPGSVVKPLWEERDSLTKLREQDKREHSRRKEPDIRLPGIGSRSAERTPSYDAGREEYYRGARMRMASDILGDFDMFSPGPYGAERKNRWDHHALGRNARGTDPGRDKSTLDTPEIKSAFGAEIGDASGRSRVVKEQRIEADPLSGVFGRGAGVENGDVSDPWNELDYGGRDASFGGLGGI